MIANSKEIVKMFCSTFNVEIVDFVTRQNTENNQSIVVSQSESADGDDLWIVSDRGHDGLLSPWLNEEVYTNVYAAQNSFNDLLSDWCKNYETGDESKLIIWSNEDEFLEDFVYENNNILFVFNLDKL